MKFFHFLGFSHFKNTNEAHVVQLDSLRFLAIFMVMIAHWMQWSWKNPILSNIPFVHGVTLFFVLSGFLITRILIVNKIEYEQQNASKTFLWKSFYARRILRIFPIYYLLIFLLYFINYQNTREVFPYVISYTSNIYQGIHNVYIGNFNHFWSLAVEEQFYIFWPFIILLIKPRYFKAVIISVILFSLLLKVYFYLYVSNWMANSYFIFTCMHALGLGGLLAYLSIYKTNFVAKLSSMGYIIIAAVLYVLFVWLRVYYQLAWAKDIFDEFLFAVLSFLIINRAARNEFTGILKKIMEFPLFTYLGQISYGMYVYHLFIPTFFFYLLGKIGIQWHGQYIPFWYYFVLCVAVSHISFIVIETPCNNLKKRFPYKKK